MSYRYIFVFFLGVGLSTTLTSALKQAEAEPQILESYNPQESLAPLVEQLSPTVVNIEIEQEVDSSVVPFMGWGFEIPEGKVQTGQGSGFMITADGYLLTNNHVVEGADNVTVRLSDGKSYQGTVTGTDDSLDIALVKIEGESPFPYVQFGSSEKTRVGDWVVAIGNPYGLSHTVTSGIISAKGRVIGAGPYDDFLQTDASINPGNSGGPLFNLKGEVVGINTAINPRAQGIGFSVPINAVSEILEDLKSKGHASRGWLGISLGQQAEEAGAFVSVVHEKTPAAEYGLKDGDKITRMNGELIESNEDLIRKVGQQRSNSEVQFDVVRNGKEKSITVTLGERPSEREIQQGAFSKTQSSNTLGIEVSTVTNFDRRNPRKKALVVLSVAPVGAAAQLLYPGDLLLSCNGSPLSSSEVLKNMLEQDEALSLKVLRNGKTKTVNIKLGE